MTSVHTCDICGHSSSNADEIKGCEAQGPRIPEYSVSTSIGFRPFTEKEQWLRGIVAEIGVVKKTHDPLYVFEVTEEVTRDLGIQNDGRLAGRYPEDRVRWAA